MRSPRPIYTDVQEHLRAADGQWFKWNFFVLLGAIGLSFGTYLIQQAFGFVGMGINTVLFLVLTWFLNAWLTSPTLVSGSWLAGLPFLRPLGFTADYLKSVVPSVLFWGCGIVLVNSVVPWFWWPFLSYLYVIAITIAMGIWAWNFKPEGKIVKDLSWNFLVAAMVWALVGLPALSWLEPWFNPEVREEQHIEQVAAEIEAERKKVVQDAITTAAVTAATAATETNDVVDGCDQYRYDELTRCWTVTLTPNTYFEHRLDPSIPTARCPLHTANHRDVVYTTPGTTGFNLENTGNAVRQFFVYEVFAGDIGPDRQPC